MKEESFQLIKKPDLLLRKQHKALYALVVQKLEKQEAILYSEAKEIWLTQVCREVRQGIPYSWNFVYIDGQWKNVLQPMKENTIKMNVLQWLTHGIGILVFKGFLKVIPQIELEALT